MKWIDLHEKKPQNNTWVLVFGSDNSVTMARLIDLPDCPYWIPIRDYIVKMDRIVGNRTIPYHKIRYWMPLPEPPIT